jgi:hypothetical protein
MAFRGLAFRGLAFRELGIPGAFREGIPGGHSGDKGIPGTGHSGDRAFRGHQGIPGAFPILVMVV